MAKNRLKLNFQLESAEERKQFLETYLVQFDSLSPTELSTLADYLLWGKDSNGVPIGAETELRTKWTKDDEFESLDSLLENPNFNDLQLHTMGEAVPLRRPKSVFDRKEAFANAPDELKETFTNLWRQIDETDLLINFYEFENGKREKPPRDELLRKFSNDEINSIRARALQLSQFVYLKKRHELIELRREQFTLRDSFSNAINPQTHVNAPLPPLQISFDADVDVRPLGLCTGFPLLFDINYDPAHLNDQQLNQISKFLLQKEKPALRTFDFREVEPVYQLLLYYDELIDRAQEAKEAHLVENNIKDLLQTLDFYISYADLTDVQREILTRKIHHEKNSDIASYINKTFGKSYTANYISTIFRQKIIPKINEGARMHWEVVSNYFWPENFKKCTCCGRLLLLHEYNWVRKSRSKDGFQSRCKRCEKKLRKKQVRRTETYEIKFKR